MNQSNTQNEVEEIQSKKSYDLKAESELRLEIPNTNTTKLQSTSYETTCRIRLVQGTAELFGVELALEKDYLLNGCSKVAIFTWHGCTIDVYGVVEMAYISTENIANLAYVNTHAQLQLLRSKSTQEDSDAPRVLITGPADSGKTTLVRLLSSYAIKSHNQPIIVDLDVSQNLSSIPGSISAMPLSSYDCFSVSSFSNNTFLSKNESYCLWYGSTDLFHNVDLYKSQLVTLGQVLNKRLEKTSNEQEKSSGIIVNTCGSITEGTEGYNLLLHAIDALQINIILVLGHDRLYSMLSSSLTKQKIVKLPRSGGVVSRDTNIRRLLRIQNIKQYFYGELLLKQKNLNYQYEPMLNELPFNSLKIYKISSVSLTESMLPVSAKQTSDSIQLNLVEITTKIKHAILGVCAPDAKEEFDRSRDANVLYGGGVVGFVAVEKVDLDKGIIGLLCPDAGKELISDTFLLGDITWME